MFLSLILVKQKPLGQPRFIEATDTHSQKPHGKMAAVEVADNGRGIAPEHMPNIFRPFFTTKGDGTGLGLSLARRIVEAHQGRIDVTSIVGQGTTFAVLLPLQQTAAASSAS